MSIQQIIEGLLRSRIFKTTVEIEMDSGATHRGFVREIAYAGSRSTVDVALGPRSGAVRLPLAGIVRVRTAKSASDGRGAVA